MESLFQNTTLLNKEIYYEFYKFDLGSRKAYKYARLLFLIVGILSILTGILVNDSNGDGVTGISVGVALIAYVGLSRVLIKLGFKRQVKTDKRIQTPLTLEYAFMEDSFKVMTKTDEGNIPYENLYKVVESNTYFYLYLNASVAYIVSKECFSVGTPGQFRAFMIAKKAFKFYNYVTNKKR